MWLEIARALCLVLILEGILPFLYPGRWRQMVALVAQVGDRELRIMGLISMGFGVVVLFLIN